MKLYKCNQWFISGLIFCIFIGMTAVRSESQESGKEATVSSGKQVSIEYTLTLEDKSVLDSNVGADPLTIIQGSHHIIPGLENALEGMKIGDSKHVTVKPEEGYGLVDKDAFVEIKKEQVPQVELKVGLVLQGQNEGGQIVQARVAEINEQTVLLDCNHPLAGKTLYFDVKVLEIKEVPAS